MNTDFFLQKRTWDERDFEQMDWHDSRIYAFEFKAESFEFALDIDYILQWVRPNDDETSFKFWVAPATLVFRNIWNLNMEIGSLDLEIQDLQRSNPRPPKNVNYIKESLEYDWLIETNSGEISFTAVGYKQYFRKEPFFSNLQSISFSERGGVSFEIL